MATMIESISAVTLATHDMSRAVHFYRTVVRRLNSRASGRERAFSISLRGRGAKLVLGARHFLSFHRRHSLCGRDCGRVSPQLGAARRQMGRASLSPHRSGWSPTELRFATGDVLSQKYENASGPLIGPN